MSIEIKTGAAFEKRLAELAWDHASDIAKTTIANTISLAMLADGDLARSLSSNIISELTERAIESIRQSDEIVSVTNDARDKVKKAITETCKPLVDELSVNAEYPIEQMRSTVIGDSVRHATEQIVSDLRKHIDENMNIRGIAMKAIHNGAIEAAIARANQSSVSVDNEFRAATVKALESMKRT